MVEQLEADLDRPRIPFANCGLEIQQQLFGALSVELAQLFELERRLPRDRLLEGLVTGLTADGVIRRKAQTDGNFNQRLRPAATDATEVESRPPETYAPTSTSPCKRKRTAS